MIQRDWGCEGIFDKNTAEIWFHKNTAGLQERQMVSE